MKIFILGDTGLFGSYLKDFFKKKKIKFSCNLKNKNNLYVDFSNTKKSHEYLNKVDPDIIINLAALTDVDLCEKKKEKAKKLNFKIPYNLSIWLKKNSKKFLIHFSTDQVYSGKGPHKENKINLINHYAKTKKLGEDALLSTNSIIIRTNFFGRSKSNKISFSDWIYFSSIKNKKFYLFKNIKFSPLRMETLCKLILIMIKKKYNGVYNVGSKKGMSKAHFGFNFLKYLKIKNKNYEFVNFKQNFTAKRSKDMRMDLNKFENKFQIKLPDLKKEIYSETKNYKYVAENK